MQLVSIEAASLLVTALSPSTSAQLGGARLAAHREPEARGQRDDALVQREQLRVKRGGHRSLGVAGDGLVASGQWSRRPSVPEA